MKPAKPVLNRPHVKTAGIDGGGGVRRWRFQFSLRSLLLIIALLCVLATYVNWRRERTRNLMERLEYLEYKQGRFDDMTDGGYHRDQIAQHKKEIAKVAYELAVVRYKLGLGPPTAEK